MNILVIEDEKFILESIAKTLRNEGYTVFTAEDRETAMDLIQVKKLDLIISDVMLPFSGGFDIVEYVKENPEKRNIPVILVTGMDEDVLKTTRTEADAVLIKPFTTDQLLALINKFLQQKIAV